MIERHPLAAPIERALTNAFPKAGRDFWIPVILAEIEADFGPITVEYDRGSGLIAEQQRLSGEWVAKPPEASEAER